MAVGLGMVGQLTVVSEGGSTPITHIWLLTSVSTPHMATETVRTRKATANKINKKRRKKCTFYTQTIQSGAKFEQKVLTISRDPLCPRRPVTAHSVSLLHLVAAGQQTLHTSMPAYANRHEILVRLVASFPLLFTTSGDVLCSKFSAVRETLYIFKVARWAHDRCMKINKSPTVRNGIRAPSSEI